MSDPITDPPPSEDPPDSWMGGRLRLHQPARGAHRAGTDAVLLASLLNAGRDAVICDIGSGTGAVGLAMGSRFPGARIILAERDPDLATCAARNAALNDMAERATVLTVDVLAPARMRQAAGLSPGMADLVLTNPPFFETARYRPSPVPGKAYAHGFAPGGLALWLRTCVGVLRPSGRLGMIHRADALPACLEALHGRFGDVAVRPVHAKSGRPAIRILITAVKGSRAPFTLLPALILHGEDGRFTPQCEALNIGSAWIEPNR